MATSSTFSYAQAAKGQVASTSSTATATQSTPVVNGHPATSKNTSSEQDGFEVSAIKGEVSELTSKPTESSNEPTEPQEGVSSNAGPTGTDPRSSSVSLAGSRRDDDDAATESSTRRSEKGAARSPSSSTRVTDDADAKKGQRKGRKGKNGDAEKKTKEAEKEKEKEKELPKVELFEAPIPSVNIWAQRQEAQAAKVKTSPTPIRADASAPNAAEPEPKKKAKAETVAPTSVQYGGTNGVRPPKTDGDANVKRSAPRGSRVTDKAGALPPVGDSASWPTPETAIKEDKTKPSEKSEKTEAQEDIGANKTRRREWERIDFVPTVNWETPIPATRGSRGGRSGPGTRGGREATSRPSHNGAPAQTAEKSAETTNVPAKTNGEHRERTREGGAHRANSLPPATAKASTTDARNDQRKPGASKVPKTRENGPAPSAEPLASRGEGRGERSRGGFHRGRGGGHTAGNASAHNQQNFMANGNAFSSQAGGPRGGHYMSPPLSQGNAFPGYGSAPGRGGRGGNRGQAGGFGSRGNGHNGGSRPRPISTVNNFPPFQWDPAYAGMPLTAPPYAPQQFNFEVKAILTQQVEYYFSLDNLCKDQHLRSFMDGQGFVTLSLIRNFHRVNKLCGDNLALLRAACAEMTLVDLCMSPDGIERLRSRQHPHAFILPVEQRQESARNPGPESYFICNNDQYQHQMQMGMVGIPFGPGAGAPYMNGVGYDDGSAHINGSQSSDGNGQLSAAVPEFQPAGLNGSADQQEKSVPEAVVTNGVAQDTEPATQTLVNGTHSEPQTTETLQS